MNLITYKVDHLLLGNNNVNQEHVLALPRFMISRPTEPIAHHNQMKLVHTEWLRFGKVQNTNRVEKNGHIETRAKEPFTGSFFILQKFNFM